MNLRRFAGAAAGLTLLAAAGVACGDETVVSAPRSASASRPIVDRFGGI